MNKPVYVFGSSNGWAQEYVRRKSPREHGVDPWRVLYSAQGLRGFRNGEIHLLSDYKLNPEWVGSTWFCSVGHEIRVLGMFDLGVTVIEVPDEDWL